MTDAKQKPIVVTPELVAMVLTRSLAIMNWLADDDLRLREYVHSLYTASIKFAEDNGIEVPTDTTGTAFAEQAIADLVFTRKAIETILRQGTVAPKEPQIGQYL